MTAKLRYRFIRRDIGGPVATIDLDRPEARNSITLDLALEVHDAVRRGAADSAARVLVFRGVGADFCCSADPKGGGTNPTGAGEKAPELDFYHISTLLHEMGAVTIAAVRGDHQRQAGDRVIALAVVAQGRRRSRHPDAACPGDSSAPGCRKRDDAATTGAVCCMKATGTNRSMSLATSGRLNRWVGGGAHHRRQVEDHRRPADLLSAAGAAPPDRRRIALTRVQRLSC